MFNIESLLKIESTVMLPVSEFPSNPNQGEIICIDNALYTHNELNEKTKWYSILGNNADQTKPLNVYNLFSAVDLDNTNIKIEQKQLSNILQSDMYWFVL
jgi:hypothetical protein